MSIPLSGRAALVISECQRGIVEPGMGGFPGLIRQVQKRAILPRIAMLARQFRERGLPVVHLTIAHRPDFADVAPNSLLAALARKNRPVVAGTPEAEIVAELAPAAEDFVVQRSSGLIGLAGTATDATLRRMGIVTVVLVGVSTNVAVAGCAMVASDLGYQVFIAEDCVAAADPDAHTLIVEQQLRMIARIATAEEITGTLP